MSAAPIALLVGSMMLLVLMLLWVAGRLGMVGSTGDHRTTTAGSPRRARKSDVAVDPGYGLRMPVRSDRRLLPPHRRRSAVH